MVDGGTISVSTTQSLHVDSTYTWTTAQQTYCPFGELVRQLLRLVPLEQHGPCAGLRIMRTARWWATTSLSSVFDCSTLHITGEPHVRASIRPLRKLLATAAHYITYHLNSLPINKPERRRSNKGIIHHYCLIQFIWHRLGSFVWSHHSSKNGGGSRVMSANTGHSFIDGELLIKVL